MVSLPCTEFGSTSGIAQSIGAIFSATPLTSLEAARRPPHGVKAQERLHGAWYALPHIPLIAWTIMSMSRSCDAWLSMDGDTSLGFVPVMRQEDLQRQRRTPLDGLFSDTGVDTNDSQ